MTCDPPADPELAAMAAIAAALDPLPPEARSRVLWWAKDRFVGAAALARMRVQDAAGDIPYGPIRVLPND